MHTAFRISRAQNLVHVRKIDGADSGMQGRIILFNARALGFIGVELHSELMAWEQPREAWGKTCGRNKKLFIDIY